MHNNRMPQNRPLMKYGVRTALQGRVLVSFAACLLPALLPIVIRFLPLSKPYLDFVFVDAFTYRFSLIAILLSFLASIFVTDPMSVRVSAFFLQLNRAPDALPSPLSVCDCFGPGYLRLLTGMLQKNLRILAWAIIPLLIGISIPGTLSFLKEEGSIAISIGEGFLFSISLFAALLLYIYRSLLYAMVPYLLAEYPDASVSDVMRMSRAMTRGRLFELILLDLSFLGWQFLVSITLYIAAIYAYPYIEGTMAAYYQAFHNILKEESQMKNNDSESTVDQDAP